MIDLTEEEKHFLYRLYNLHFIFRLDGFEFELGVFREKVTRRPLSRNHNSPDKMDLREFSFIRLLRRRWFSAEDRIVSRLSRLWSIAFKMYEIHVRSSKTYISLWRNLLNILVSCHRHHRRYVWQIQHKVRLFTSHCFRIYAYSKNIISL